MSTRRAVDDAVAAALDDLAQMRRDYRRAVENIRGGGLRGKEVDPGDTRGRGGENGWGDETRWGDESGGGDMNGWGRENGWGNVGGPGTEGGHVPARGRVAAHRDGPPPSLLHRADR